MISLCIVLSLFVWLSAAQQQQTATTICPQPGYLLADNTSLCYSYKQTSVDFFAANRSCVREGAILLSIESASEDVYIWRTFFNGSGGVEFWIGLNDLDTEGIFRWLNSSLRDPPPTYTNWSGGAVSGNLRSLDCAKFTSTGWMLHSLPCSTSSLFYVCKMFSCRSNNGEHCIGEEPTVSSSSGVEPWVLAVIIVVLILVIVIIGIIILLVILWKFNNDAFNRYCCCCLSRGAQSNVHSLQQENQRLRHELSQHKLSTSGRYSQGQFARELSGVPDGRGGVLPTIKAPLTTPSIPENQPLTFGTSPPPLVPQRVSTTRVTPLRHPSVTTPTSGTAPFGVFTSGNAPSSSLRRQSAPVLLSGLNQPLRAKRSIPFPMATTIEEEKKESEEEGVSSSEEESEHSALDKTDKGTTE